MARHFGIGLLSMRIDDDLALEDAVTLPVEHRAEPFAACAAARCVLDHQRVVHVLAISREGGAADQCLGSLATESHERLVAYDAAASSEGEVVIGRVGTHRHAERGEPQRRLAIIADSYMVDPRMVPDDELEDGVDLVVEACRPFETLDQCQLRAWFDDHHAARIHCRRGFACEHMGDMHRLTRILFHAQRDTTGHEGGVQPECNIVFAGDFPEKIGLLLGCKGEKLTKRDARILRVKIAPTRLVTSVDNGYSARHATLIYRTYPV